MSCQLYQLNGATIDFPVWYKHSIAYDSDQKPGEHSSGLDFFHRAKCVLSL